MNYHLKEKEELAKALQSAEDSLISAIFRSDIAEKYIIQNSNNDY